MCTDSTNTYLNHLIGILIGFLTFFLFPIIQHLWTKLTLSKEANPELWYLPAFGFRLVIRNIPRKRKLYNLRYQSKLVQIVPESKGASVATILEELLVKDDQFYLMPGNDQIILCFKLVRKEGKLLFVHTDKLGNAIKKWKLSELESIVCDYFAQVDNYFHYDISVGFRVHLERDKLVEYFSLTERNRQEQKVHLDQVIKIGSR